MPNKHEGFRLGVPKGYYLLSGFISATEMLVVIKLFSIQYGARPSRNRIFVHCQTVVLLELSADPCFRSVNSDPVRYCVAPIFILSFKSVLVLVFSIDENLRRCPNTPPPSSSLTVIWWSMDMDSSTPTRQRPWLLYYGGSAALGNCWVRLMALAR